MRIRLISLGVNWWSTHSPDLADPFCFRRQAAWFNSAGLMYGRRLRLCWVFPGYIRFNSNSGFNPEYPQRTLGRVFESTGPHRLNGKVHLLLARLNHTTLGPERFLVTLNAETHGQVSFSLRSWKSPTAQPISVSLRPPRYEAMLLIGNQDWIQTDVGIWMMSADSSRLELAHRDSRASQ